ncbi:MAG TPA: tetratricopeptide repeat protein [Rhizomicrobium sp.]|nr:tetratricopeptide repeat protein [Rhizomicrobium sp.]
MQPDEDPIGHAEELIAAGRAREAASFLNGLLAAGRGGLLMRLTLARALSAAGDTAGAMAVAREAAGLHPDVAVVATALGEAMLAAGHLPTAIGEFQRALRLDPNSDDARLGVARAWLEAGEPEKALEALQAVPDAPEALIAEAEAMHGTARSNARYVRHLFDQFSSDYDARMIGQLGYQAPGILRALADMLMIGAERKLAILDLGCGTGLCGAAFHDIASRLDGIDLSPAMIGKARALGIYDELVVADIETGALDRRYDLMLAADTVVYLGDLAPVLASIAARLVPDGMFLFTAEAKDGEGFGLGPKRRWRHSDAYLREEAAKAGFDIAGLMDCSPRTEAGAPVAGFAVALRLAEKVG